jgi:hypothetical protein
MNELEKEFLPYDLSLKMKALGFDEPCVYYVDKNNNSYIYNFQTHPDEFIEWCGVNVIPTPTFSQCFRWFREKYNIDAWVQPFTSIKSNGKMYLPDESYSFFIFKDGIWVDDKIDFVEPENAELACLIKLIEIVESKNETR